MENIHDYFLKATQASKAIKRISTSKKKQILEGIAAKLEANIKLIIAQNQLDLDKMDDADPKKDRLLLNAERIASLSKSLHDIALLQDPSNQLVSSKKLPNGLLIEKKTVALGVVGVIYEARPNVTVDVAALCIMSGNVCLLRGGSDAFFTNIILVQLIQEVLKDFNLDSNLVQLLPVERKHIYELLTADKYVDMIIPRGSQQLIDFVRENAKVPVIETGAGVCHTYVETSANVTSAALIVHNAKVSRPSVCNALDTVLVDKAIAESFLTQLIPLFLKDKVGIFADDEAYQILANHHYPFLTLAKQEDFGREFLSLQCSIKTVKNIDEALAHIQNYSSKHSEAIVSEDEEKIAQFLNEVDAAAVYANASTRFTDGGEFGLGAEIGISTQKLHARGPFALEKLVTEKWFVTGNGQIR